MAQKIDLTQQVQGVLPPANGGAGPNAGLAFADAETPAGLINSSNKTYTLNDVPNPAASLLLFLNKTLQIQGTDYTLAGNVITMVSAPPTSATFLGWYRYQSFQQQLTLMDTLAMVDFAIANIANYQLIATLSDQLVLTDQLAKIVAPNRYEDYMVMEDNVILFLGTSQLPLADTPEVMADAIAYELAGSATIKLAIGDRIHLSESASVVKM